MLERESLDEALRGIHTAFYLIHSMGESNEFEEIERRGAENFAAAARRCGVQRIIYLGGLGDEEVHLSAHLRSRQTVGKILRSSGVETIEFRASIIIGSGSLSFEMIRDLVEKLPVMTTPRWVSVKAQPIGILDLLEYLRQAIHLRPAESRVFEIGGTDRVTYAELMKEYARQRGLRRYMIPLPVLTPRLSSLWLALVTPLYARVGRKLIDSIRHPTVVRDDSALAAFSVRPRGLRQTIAEALKNEDREFAATRWSDAGSAGGRRPNWGGVRFGKRLVDSRTVQVSVPPAPAFGPIRRIGGRNGWYYCNWLWRVRGFLDLLAGGIGLRRGRHSPENLEVGEPLDWWRIEAYEADRLLRLSAEMKVPGRAWLQFEVTGEADGSTLNASLSTCSSPLPAGDVYLLAHILHDWDDERCTAILRNCAASMNKGGRVAIVEHLIPPPNTADQSLIVDLEMLVMTEGGRERTLEEFDQLFSASGLRRTDVFETGLPWRIIEASK